MDAQSADAMTAGVARPEVWSGIIKVARPNPKRTELNRLMPERGAVFSRCSSRRRLFGACRWQRGIKLGDGAFAFGGPPAESQDLKSMQQLDNKPINSLTLAASSLFSRFLL